MISILKSLWGKLPIAWKPIAIDIGKSFLVSLLFVFVIYISCLAVKGRYMEQHFLIAFLFGMLGWGLGSLKERVLSSRYFKINFGIFLGLVLFTTFLLTSCFGFFEDNPVTVLQLRNKAGFLSDLSLVSTGFVIFIPVLFTRACHEWKNIPFRYFSPVSIDSLQQIQDQKIAFDIYKSRKGIRWIFIDGLSSISTGVLQVAQGDTLDKASVLTHFKASIFWNNFMRDIKNPISYTDYQWAFKANAEDGHWLDPNKGFSENNLRFHKPEADQLLIPVNKLPEGFKIVNVYVKSKRNTHESLS